MKAILNSLLLVMAVVTLSSCGPDQKAASPITPYSKPPSFSELFTVTDAIVGHPSFDRKWDPAPIRFSPEGNPMEPLMLMSRPIDTDAFDVDQAVERSLEMMLSSDSIMQTELIFSIAVLDVQATYDGKLWFILRVFVYPADSLSIEQYNSKVDADPTDRPNPFSRKQKA